MERLKLYLEFLKKKKTELKELPHSFIVLDDIVNTIQQKLPAWQEFITTYRHYNITLLVTTQFINKCDPTLREQAEYAYIFQLQTSVAIKATYENYGGLFRTIKAWTAFLEKISGEQYRCLIWKKESKPIIKERYSTYKVPDDAKEYKFEY